MRITKSQMDAFITAISAFILKDETVELNVYGSRTNDALRGGDIDLLLLTHSEEQRQYLAINKAKILAKIFMQIDEEKIDITIANAESKPRDPFIESILPNAQCIHRFSQ